MIANSSLRMLYVPFRDAEILLLCSTAGPYFPGNNYNSRLVIIALNRDWFVSLALRAAHAERSAFLPDKEAVYLSLTRHPLKPRGLPRDSEVELSFIGHRSEVRASWGSMGLRSMPLRYFLNCCARLSSQSHLERSSSPWTSQII